MEPENQAYVPMQQVVSNNIKKSHLPQNNNKTKFVPYLGDHSCQLTKTTMRVSSNSDEMKTDTKINDCTDSNAASETVTEETEITEIGQQNNDHGSNLMLGLLDEFTKIYKDKLERLENSALKLDEKEYLRVSNVFYEIYS